MFFYAALATVFIVNTASTCSSDDDSSTSSPTTTEVINTVSQGTWRVTSFVEDGSDHTNYFSNFDFTFGDSNMVTASNGTSTYTGTWSVISDSRSDDDDDSGDSLDFNIFFSSPDDFTELNEDWDILERTNSRVRLQHISGGDGSLDTLTFEKN